MRSTSRRQTRNVAISRTRTTASVYFVSSPMPGSDSEQRPRTAPKREPQRQPEDDHRRQLIERDRLEQQVCSQHPRREPDHHRRERLRTARRPELPGDEGTDHDRSRACEDRERAKTDQRPAEQLSGQRREQRRHRRKLDVPALEMQPGDGVIQLVAVPAVPPGDGKLSAHFNATTTRTGLTANATAAFTGAPVSHGAKPRTPASPRA